MSKLLAHFNFENGVTSEQYDNVWADLRAGGYSNPKGLISHVGAAKPGGGWKVIDIWESEQDFQNFGNVLMPILAKNNMPMIQPEVLPVHYLHEK